MAQILFVTASVRLCMGSRRGFICRMKMGNMQVDPMTANHSLRIRQHSTLGPSTDGNHYSIVHVTGYIKNWPPSGNLISLNYFIVRFMVFWNYFQAMQNYSVRHVS